MKAIRLSKYQRGESFHIVVDGERLLAYQGETLASVLMTAGRGAFFQNPARKRPSKLYCGMGVCMQCLVTVDGENSCKACSTIAQPGMKVETGV